MGDPNKEDDVHDVFKEGQVQNKVKQLAAIACIQRLWDFDLIPNFILQTKFLPGNIHFFPKALFENNDINGPVINCDQQTADSRVQQYEYEHRENSRYYIENPDGIDPGHHTGGYSAGQSKSRIHKFGELNTLPVKIVSKSVDGPNMSRPIRGREMNSH